ncbi:MAG: DUF4168 domain-containing protein [Gammaproteobacteria bacterium]|nr:DUF4168 domain-containing protein [Gammaproteobacteria bacterium]
MKDIMLNYYKHIALPACLALVFGMPLASQAGDNNATLSKDKYQYGDEYKGSMEQIGGQTGLDNATKQKFVAAYIEIKKILGDYTGKLETVSDEKKARELQKQAQVKMSEVVESNDMTVHEYNQIVSIISSDSELRREIENMT